MEEPKTLCSWVRLFNIKVIILPKVMYRKQDNYFQNAKIKILFQSSCGISTIPKISKNSPENEEQMSGFLRLWFQNSLQCQTNQESDLLQEKNRHINRIWELNINLFLTSSSGFWQAYKEQSMQEIFLQMLVIHDNNNPKWHCIHTIHA